MSLFGALRLSRASIHLLPVSDSISRCPQIDPDVPLPFVRQVVERILQELREVRETVRKREKGDREREDGVRERMDLHAGVWVGACGCRLSDLYISLSVCVLLNVFPITLIISHYVASTRSALPPSPFSQAHRLRLAELADKRAALEGLWEAIGYTQDEKARARTALDAVRACGLARMFVGCYPSVCVYARACAAMRLCDYFVV